MAGDTITVEGTVREHRRGDVYEVDATIGPSTRRVLARRSGRLVKHAIKIVAGDLVTLELTPYDLGRGRIVYRGKKQEHA